MHDLINRTWEGEGMSGAALFSPCENYRYSLAREWVTGSYLLPVVMLNPSTATESVLDPTITRVCGFARREGFGGIHVGNIFAFRATRPEVMKDEVDPVGPFNDEALANMAKAAAQYGTPILCGWGAHGDYRGRSKQVWDIFQKAGAKAVCLGMTNAGQPKHPLYIKADQPFIPWEPIRGA